MLSELSIQNFAIIDKLSLEFEDGLIIFTGETGAGKSIIIDAVEAILGGRTDNTMIRSGAQEAIVEAIFQLQRSDPPQIKQILSKEGLLDDENQVILGREIRKTGKNLARINGRNVSVGLLREIGNYLVDIHGQSEHLTLLKTKYHLPLLDRFAITIPGNKLSSLLQNYQETYRELQKIQKEISALKEAEKDSARQEDLLKYQINEIESAYLQPGEEEILLDERKRLTNAEQLATLAQDALLTLEEGTPEVPSAIDRLGELLDILSRLSAIDKTQVGLHTSAENTFEEANELARSLREYIEEIEYNPDKLNQVEDRLFLIQNLRKKYGDSIPEILSFLEQAKESLEAITHSEERLAELEKQMIKLENKLAKLGSEISNERHSAATKLESAIEKELTELQMEKAKFRVSFEMIKDENGILMKDGNKYAFFSDGMEKVEFLIESNPGEGFKPLVKIASGGETSRLMLSLKSVLAEADEIPTLIFDEIDQGIGGRVGTSVGKKLRKLAETHQVLCVTHLPQLAAFGTQHFNIQKTVINNRTVTQAKELKKKERIKELAQMMGTVSEGTTHSAKELLKLAKEFDR